ncbi:hypothetical protein EZJ43_07755 [Pedobacter changchengzhani]|uniref:Uncharacterized protein n=1 Tax=Pedobacter changchengzhani TaxID=2529274 RepID=A0A4R5ML42_9SPHI|nr:hypothetical protein [Pedobacter changchengzhani]TDG36404.1 hypothetical protein EZJ43_07755 [Pedobacter changchengzhani]
MEKVDRNILDFKDSDSMLRIVVDLYKEIWNDSTKWKENAFKMEQNLNGLSAVNPNDTRVLTNLGALYSLKGEHKQALEVLLKAEKLNATDANLYSNIAIAKMNMEEERNNAKEYFEMAKKLKPNELTIESYFDPQGY